MPRPDHIILSGATGFLGSHLLKALLARRYDVTILKRSTSNTWRIEPELNSVRSIDVDIQPIEAAFSVGNVDTVIHTACNYGRNGESTSQILETNVQFSLRLLEAAILGNAIRFFNTDTLLRKSVNPYALSKNQFVDWLKLHQSQIQIVNLRLEHMYGPADDITKFVPWIIDRLLGDSTEIPLTPGFQKRDFVHVQDVVAAFMHLIESFDKDGFSEFDIGSGKMVTIRELVATLRNIVHEVTQKKHLSDAQFGAVPYRSGEIMEPEIDLTAISATGWTAATSLYDGLSELVAQMYQERSAQ